MFSHQPWAELARRPLCGVRRPPTPRGSPLRRSIHLARLWLVACWAGMVAYAVARLRGGVMHDEGWGRERERVAWPSLPVTSCRRWKRGHFVALQPSAPSSSPKLHQHARPTNPQPHEHAHSPIHARRLRACPRRTSSGTRTAPRPPEEPPQARHLPRQPVERPSAAKRLPPRAAGTAPGRARAAAGRGWPIAHTPPNSRAKPNHHRRRCRLVAALNRNS